MGINQMIEKKPMEMPRMQLCFRWSVYSESEMAALNISNDLATVLQWRIEGTHSHSYSIPRYSSRGRGTRAFESNRSFKNQ